MPEIQIRVAKNIERAYFGEAPTLNVVSKAYSEEVLISWIEIHLESLNDFCGVSKKMNNNQMTELASIIAIDYYFLKVSELLLFFYRLKTGRYGKFFGVVDSMVVLEALSKFSSERIREIQSFEKQIKDQELNKQREEWKKNAVSRAQWEQMKIERKKAKQDSIRQYFKTKKVKIKKKKKIEQRKY